MSQQDKAKPNTGNALLYVGPGRAGEFPTSHLTVEELLSRTTGEIRQLVATGLYRKGAHWDDLVAARPDVEPKPEPEQKAAPKKRPASRSKAKVSPGETPVSEPAPGTVTVSVPVAEAIVADSVGETVPPGSED